MNLNKMKEIATIKHMSGTEETLVCMFSMYTAEYWIMDSRGVLTRKLTDTTASQFLDDLRVIGYESGLLMTLTSGRRKCPSGCVTRTLTSSELKVLRAHQLAYLLVGGLYRAFSQCSNNI